MSDQEGSRDPSPAMKNNFKEDSDSKHNSSPLVRKSFVKEKSSSKIFNELQNETTPQRISEGENFENEKKYENEIDSNADENSPQKQDWRNNDKSYSQDNLNVEQILDAEKQKLTVIFQKEMEEKLKELDEKLSEYWSKKYDEIQQSYENRISQYEELLQASHSEKGEGIVQQEMIEKIEKEMSEKYQQQYLDKISEIQENFKAIEEANLMQIVEEIKKELEAQYTTKYNEQVQTLREEAKREIEKFQGENKWNEQDEFQKMLEVDVRSSVERSLKEKYEVEKEALIKKYMQEQNALKKEINTMENKIKEKLEVEVKEELEKEYSRKEKLLNLNWRKKMESYKKTLEEDLEKEMKTKIDNERKEIEKAKVEISRIKSLENVRLKKAEDGKKALEQKLKEQEEKYEKMINNLKKQIEQIKDTSNLGDDERVVQSTKRTENKGFRSSSLTRSGRQPLDNQAIETNFKRVEQSPDHDFEKFNELSRSRSQSPVEDSRNKMVSLIKRENSEEKNVSQKKPFYQSALSLRNRPDHLNTEEPSKALLNMIDPMAPPELFSQENKQRIDLPLQERESVQEEKKFPLLQQSERGSTYENLKAQIMKKYSPQKNLEDTERNLEDQNQFTSKQLISPMKEEYGLESNFSSQPILFSGQQNQAMKKENLSPIHNFEEDAQGTNKGESFMKKYEAILQKYSKEGFAKEKYKSLASSKESFYKDVPSRDGDSSSNKNKYQTIFESKPDDDAKAKEFKKLKKSFENKIEKDTTLESKYLAREIYFTTDFLTKTNIETTGQQKTLKNSLKTLYDLWNEIETSYQARLSFMDNIELITDYDSLMKKITLEIDYLKVTQKNIGEIMGFVKKRNYYRDQINTENFDYKKYKKLYFAIDANNLDLRKLLDPYKRKYNKEALYKGIEICEIIKVDAWEHEYLQKLELKEEILDKIRKKF